MTPESDISSDNNEDPADDDYGKRKSTRKISTPRKTPIKGANSSSKKKRKRETASTPQKRSRPKVHGQANGLSGNANGSENPATANLFI